MVLVFCDLTPGQNTTAIEMVIQAAQRLIKSCTNADIIFFPISKNLYTPELLHKYPEASNTPKTKNENTQYQNLIRTKIMERYKSKENITEESCILGSLGLAYDRFKQEDVDTSDNLSIIFLSDMMEHCTYQFGKINLRDKTRIDNYIATISINKPEFNLAKLGVRISIMMTVPTDLPIIESEHRRFWNQAFTNFGYSDSAIQGITFSSNLPEYLLYSN